MNSPVLNTRTLLALTQAILDDMPLGLLLLDISGQPLWYNREGALVCAVWNHGEVQGQSLRLTPAIFSVPEAVRRAGQELIGQASALPRVVSEPARGLHARLELRSVPDEESLIYVQLDYRRPRSDRDVAFPPKALALVCRLSDREREVAVRVRDGLSTAEIAQALNRSPLTIKTQLGSIFSKLGVRNRAHLAALLNRG